MARIKDPMAFLYSLPKADFTVEVFYAPGQQVNEDKCAVRITHLASGAVGECSEERRQPLNKRRAFERLTETEAYRKWHMQQAIQKLGRS
jgi:protein subunit release factor A